MTNSARIARNREWARKIAERNRQSTASTSGVVTGHESEARALCVARSMSEESNPYFTPTIEPGAKLRALELE